MSQHTCPACGHTWTPAKGGGRTSTVPKGTSTEVDVSQLTDAELYAYRKRTAPVEDARFFLRTQPVQAELRTQFEDLISRNPGRTQFYRELYRLQVAHWRTVPYFPFVNNVEQAAQDAAREALAAESVPEDEDTPDEDEAPGYEETYGQPD